MEGLILLQLPTDLKLKELQLHVKFVWKFDGRGEWELVRQREKRGRVVFFCSDLKKWKIKRIVGKLGIKVHVGEIDSYALSLTVLFRNV